MNAPKTPLSLTIRIPFCKSRCGYCDRHVLTECDSHKKEAYVHALYREIAAVAPEMDGYQVTTIHLAGGSVNLLGGAVLKELLGQVRSAFDVAEDAEITIDCVPTNVSIDLLENLSACGTVRLEVEQETLDPLQHFSLGQSFTIGAISDCMNLINGSRIKNFGIHLLYGIQGQGIPSLLASVQGCADFHASQITLRPLRLTEGTAPWQEYEKQLAAPSLSPRRQFPDESKCTQLYTAAADRLAALGYRQYTQYHFAKDGFASRLHLDRCRAAASLGIGLDTVSHYDGILCQNTGDPDLYLENSGNLLKIMEKSIDLTQEQEAGMALAAMLFSTDGASCGTFRSIYGLEPSSLRPDLMNSWKARGWMQETDGRLVLTATGASHYQEISESLMPDIE